jgi:peptidoglycan/xylan/chitin deacetylase (PgdA/CDA1 family)
MRAASHPELIRRTVEEGHEAGLHTVTHPDLAYVGPWRLDMETRLSQNALAGAAGIRAGLAPRPYSSVPSAVTETCCPCWSVPVPRQTWCSVVDHPQKAEESHTTPHMSLERQSARRFKRKDYW